MKTFKTLKWIGYVAISIPSIFLIVILIAGIASINRPSTYLIHKKPKTVQLTDTIKVYDTVRVKVYDTVKINPTPAPVIIKKEEPKDTTLLKTEITPQ